MTRIAVIGLGTMGRAATEKLVAAGHKVTAADPAPAATDVARDLGITHAPDLATAIKGAEIALMFLPGPDQIRQVVAGSNGLLARADGLRVIADHSTADPETARDMAELAEARGLGWVDAPILGRPQAVGKWSLPCGATPGALVIATPVFQAYAANVFDVGAPGTGHVVKLLNQMMFGAINAVTAEMVATSERLGLPPARLFEIIANSGAATVSNLFRELGRCIQEDRYHPPTFSLELLSKDVWLGLAMAQQAGLSPQLVKAVTEMNEAGLEAGLGAQDSAALWHAIRHS